MDANTSIITVPSYFIWHNLYILTVQMPAKQLKTATWVEGADGALRLSVIPLNLDVTSRRSHKLLRNCNFSWGNNEMQDWRVIILINIVCICAQMSINQLFIHYFCYVPLKKSWPGCIIGCLASQLSLSWTVVLITQEKNLDVIIESPLKSLFHRYWDIIMEGKFNLFQQE